jgi:hypothetical protein
LETATSYSKPNQGNRVGVPLQKSVFGQKLNDRERLVSWSIVIVENPIIEPNFRSFLYTASHNHFTIPYKLGSLFAIVEWVQREQYPWYQRGNGHCLYLCDFHTFHVLATLFEPFLPLKNTLLFHSFSIINLREHCTSVTSMLFKFHTKFNVDSLL